MQDVGWESSPESRSHGPFLQTFAGRRGHPDWADMAQRSQAIWRLPHTQESAESVVTEARRALMSTAFGRGCQGRREDELPVTNFSPSLPPKPKTGLALSRVSL